MHGGALDFWLLAVAAALLVVLWRRQGWLHPTTLFAAFWTLTMAARIFAPMLQADMTSTAAYGLGLGIVALCAPAAVGKRARPAPEDVQLGHRGVAAARLLAATVIVGAAVAVGVYLFRGHVSDYYGGADVGQLSSAAIRQAQLSGDRGGPLTLLLSLAPLLGALGVYGGLRYSRWWYLATLAALYAALQSPARIMTLSLVVTCAVFYAYARPSLRRDPEGPAAKAKPRSRRALVVQLAVVAAAGLGYFTFTSAQLGKDTVAALYVHGWTWPQWLLSPVQYLVGGVAGFAAVSSRAAPFNDPYSASGHPVTIYLISRILGQKPDTLANFTPAPFPINVYTAFGDMWSDFGLVGVVVLSLLLGWFAHAAYRRHQLQVEWAWVAAVLVNVLVSTGMAYRLFYLDIVTLLVTGWVIFFWLRRSKKWRPTATSARPRTSSPGQRTPTG